MVEKMLKQEAVDKIKEIMGREFSVEQQEMITHFGKPLNGVAGAGSGKTTVSIGKIFYVILAKNVKPSEILSITFSKKASEEIEERYNTAKNALNKSLGSPVFKTFHAFFYSILRGIPEYRNISPCSYTDFMYDLLKEVKTDGVKTEQEVLEQYMRVRGVLVNYNISKDGLLTGTNENLIPVLKFDYNNYAKINKIYNNLKNINNKLDFDDMQSILLEYLETGRNADEIKKSFNNSFKHIILDEYQDVSPIQVDIMDKLMSDKQIQNLTVLGDDDQSQPANTDILMYGDSIKPIQDVQIGEKVVSYMQGDSFVLSNNKEYDKGYKITNKTTHYEKGLITVTTEDGHSSSYSKGHITYAKFNGNQNKFIVYILRDALNRYSVGQTKLFKNDGLVVFGLKEIMKKENYIQGWILNVFESSDDAKSLENEIKSKLYTDDSDITDSVSRILEDFGRDIQFPFIDKTKPKSALIHFESKISFELRACNLLPEVMDLIVREPITNEIFYNKLVNVDYYSDIHEFYSLEVEGYHNYVADNIVTHNCIYSFRGSQSDYIINFLDRYKNARRKFISKNYRCKNEILEEVIPMISNNKIRVDKELSAENEGGVVSYINTDDYSEFIRFKDMLMSDIKQGLDLEKEVAVLVRYNKNRMMLADKLAEEGVPTDIVHTKYLLQNNKIYQALFDIAKAIKNNDANLMKKHSTKAFKKVSSKQLDYYTNYQSDFVGDILNGELNVSADEFRYVKAIHESDNALIILANTWKLVKGYYAYMVDKKRLNEKDIKSIVTYILSLALSNSGQANISWEALLSAEEYKKAYLSDFIGDKNVLKIFTIHSVKGLEFNKVYIYGLDSDIVSEKDMKNYRMEALKTNSNDAVFSKNTKYIRSRIINALENTEDNVEEERRIFYVSCTRAIDELVICYSGSNMFQLLYEMKSFNNSVVE